MSAGHPTSTGRSTSTGHLVSSGHAGRAGHADPGGCAFRIRWLPGTDVLLGTCVCGARYECQDPVEMWDWLLAHPDHPARRETPR